MALDPNYGNRITTQAKELLPQAFEPAPQLQMQMPEQNTLLQAAQQPAQAPQPSGPTGFPKLVIDTQGTGPKLDANRLQALKDQYKLEILGPREWAKKGAKKGSVDAAGAAFDSKADRWIQDYLKEPIVSTDADNNEALKNTERGYIKGAAQGAWDTLVSAVKGATTDTISGLADLADYGVRTRNAAAAGLYTLLNPPERTTADLVAVRPQLSRFELAKAVFNHMREQDDPVFKALGVDPRKISDAINKFGEETANQFTSEQTLQARAGLDKLLEQDVSPGEIAAYIAANPSAASGYLGEAIGMIAPALATGGASAAVRGSSVVGRLAAGGRAARVAAKAIESLPAIAASSTAPTGNALGDLRRNIDEMPLESLLDSPINKELYDSLKQFGLQGETLNARFREALFNRSQDATFAGAAASNFIIPGLMGAPAERALAGLATSGTRGALGTAVRTGLAEAGQEAVSSVPDTISGNIAQSQITGQEVPLTKGLGNNALLSAGLGAVVGGTASLAGRRNPLIRQPQTSSEVEPPNTTPATPQTNTPVSPSIVSQTSTNTQQGTPVSVLDNPGTGIQGAEQHASITKTAIEDAQKLISRPTGKKAVKDLDAAGVLSQSTTIAQRAAGNEWVTMDAEQRLITVENVAEVLNKQAKAEDVASTLQAMRNSIAPPVTPAAPVEATPTQSAPTPPETAPASVVEPTTPPVAEATSPQPAAPVTSAPAATQNAKLPKELAGAKPRWANGAAVYQPQFESDIDKAFYIVGQKNKSKRDGDYRKFLTDAGYPANKLDSIAEAVRQNVRAVMETEKAGTVMSPAKVTVPAIDLPLQSGQPQTTKRRNPLKKEASRPKSEAPAQIEVQGQQEQTAPTIERESESELLRRVLGEDIVVPDINGLENAIRLAREGENTELNNSLKTLVADEDITKEQASQIRQGAISLTPAQEGLAETTAYKSFSDLWTSTLAKKNSTAVDILNGMSKLPDIAEPEKWIANKLTAAIKANDIKISTVASQKISDAKSKGITIRGSYNPVTNSINLAPAGQDIETFLHEALHAVTANLAAGKASSPEVRKLQEDLNNLLEHVRETIKSDEDLEKQIKASLFKRFDDPKGPVGNIRELISYGLTNIEFREILNKIPAPSAYGNGKSVWQALKDIFSNFFGATGENKTALDALIETSGAIVDYAAENPSIVEEARAGRLLGEENTDIGNQDRILYDFSRSFETPDSSDYSRTPTNIDVSPISKAQRLGEIFLQAAYGIERSVQLVRNAGGIINSDNNPYIASRKYTSDIAENRSTDSMETVEPVKNWIANNWRSFRSGTVEQFRTDLDKFLQNYHSLNERNPSLWAETVKLNDGQELTRASLIDDAYEGTLTGPELQKRLRDLADKYAVDSLDDWAVKNPARDPARARKVLAELKKKGFDEKSVKPLNDLIQAIRDRSRERLQQAGIISADDPFSDRGWDWYVPLKGSLETDEQAADMDIGFAKGNAKEFRNRNLKILKGRDTNAGNALEQMLVDLGQAGTMAAESSFKSSLFEYVLDNATALGAQVRRWTGTPKQGYETDYYFTKKGELREGQRAAGELPQPKYGFIFNDGTNHFEVRLPEGSQLDRGIKGLRKIAYPSDLDQNYGPIASAIRGVGTTTNVLARSYTTWSPTWQLTTAFMRDVNALPTTIAIEAFDSPWQARAFLAQYALNLSSNVLDFRNAAAEAKWIVGDKSALKEAAKNNPNSYAAKLLAFRDAGGSTEYSQSFNKETARSELFDKARLDEEGLGSLNQIKSIYNKVNEMTGNWATVLESKARVAAWEALISTGKTPKEAAALTKGAMDFSQSGEWGKMINNFIMFSRVGFTSLDVMRRAFTNKSGGLDKAKVAKWVPALAAMGAAFYTVLGSILGDDEDGVPLIKKVSADTLTQKLTLPDGKGGIVSFPIGLGLPQLLMAPGILSAAVAQGNLEPSEAVRAYYETVTRNTPVQPAGWRKGTGATGFFNSWMQAAMPSIARPVAEVASNVNAFDRAIYTDWPKSSKFASDQGFPTTPEFWKDLAKEIHENTGGFVDVYPEVLRHISKAYGGQTVNDLQRWTMDFAEKEQQGLESRAARTTLRTAVADPDFYYANEARRISEELQISERLANRAEDKYKYLSANPNDAKRINAKKELDKAYRAYSQRNKEIRNNNLMSIEGKRSQRKLNDSKLRQAVEKAKSVIDATE